MPPARLADRAGGRRRLGCDGRARIRTRLPTSTRCSPTRTANPGRFQVPGHKGGRGADPAMRELVGEVGPAQRHPLDHRGGRHRPRADAVPAGAAARRRGLGRAPHLVPDQRRLAGQPRDLPRARPRRRRGRRPAQRPLLGDRRPRAERAAADLRRPRARPGAGDRPLPDAGRRWRRRSTRRRARSRRWSSPPPTSAPAPTSPASPRSRTSAACRWSVDEAWGAHLRFHPDLPADALAAAPTSSSPRPTRSSAA